MCHSPNTAQYAALIYKQHYVAMHGDTEAIRGSLMNVDGSG
jgi:hypothetical protein